MREINKAEADRLRKAGTHGFWALYVNPVVEHPSRRYVVHAGGRWFVMEPDEFWLKFEGLTRMPVPNGKLKQMHSVHCAVTEVADLIQADHRRATKLDLGLGTPAAHGDSIKPKED